MLKNRILITLTAIGIGLGASTTLVAQDPQWKDRAEFDMFEAARTEADPVARIQKLDAWMSAYPDTQMGTYSEDAYFISYQQAGDVRKAFDKAVEIRQGRPAHGLAINLILTSVYKFQPPSAADLSEAENAARYVIDNTDAVFAESNTPGTMTPDQWTAARQPVLNLAHQTYAWVFIQREDYVTAEREIKNYLELAPTDMQFTFQLAQAIQKQENPDRILESLFYFLRAGNYTGQGAIDESQRGTVRNYGEDLYKRYSGLDAGDEYNELVTIATNNNLPPANWGVESQQERVTREFEAEQDWSAANPDWDFWNRVIEPNLKVSDTMTAEAAQATFTGNFVDALVPGQAGETFEIPFTHFRATVVAPPAGADAPGPNTLFLAVGDPERIDATVANVKLTVIPRLPADLDVTPGAMIEFEGSPKVMTQSPFLITMEADMEKPGLDDAIQAVGAGDAAETPAP